MSESIFTGEEYIKKAEELVSSIGIPSQPRIVAEINDEIKKPGADLKKISDIIARDVAMSAKLLKIANSPFFGLKEKTDSIQRALSLLGLKNFNNIILSSSLRDALGGHGPAAEKFWNHSMSAATISSQLAGRVGFAAVEQAYIAGLFHDCGIPLLLKKYPDYVQIVDYALGVVGTDSLSGTNRSIIGIEDERYSTHHCAIGFLVAKSWYLSSVVTQAILHHHYVNIDIHTDLNTRKVSAILLVADYISSYLLFLGGSSCTVDSEEDWAKRHQKVLAELSLSVEDIKDLREDFTEKMCRGD
ncbi:MAG: HDOD domain-containing protein [Nitrospiraceae bacterium]|nr:MAG: HDOD domain-containing protein [Nitrospiraceae bacterium]